MFYVYILEKKNERCKGKERNLPFNNLMSNYRRQTRVALLITFVKIV
jgi:hypothetical protein